MDDSKDDRWNRIYAVFVALSHEDMRIVSHKYHEIRGRIGVENSAQAMEEALIYYGKWQYPAEENDEYEQIMTAKAAYQALQES